MYKQYRYHLFYYFFIKIYFMTKAEMKAFILNRNLNYFHYNRCRMELWFSFFLFLLLITFHFILFFMFLRRKQILEKEKYVMHLRFTLLLLFNFLFQVPLLKKNIFTRRKLKLSSFQIFAVLLKLNYVFLSHEKCEKYIYPIHPGVA